MSVTAYWLTQRSILKSLNLQKHCFGDLYLQHYALIDRREMTAELKAAFCKTSRNTWSAKGSLSVQEEPEVCSWESVWVSLSHLQSHVFRCRGGNKVRIKACKLKWCNSSFHILLHFYSYVWSVRHPFLQTLVFSCYVFKSFTEQGLPLGILQIWIYRSRSWIFLWNTAGFLFLRQDSAIDPHVCDFSRNNFTCLKLQIWRCGDNVNIF
jgi:hypothetical protein